MLVRDKSLSRQTRVLYLSRQNLCRDKSFVATKISSDDNIKHVFVATKMILVAAPANDSEGAVRGKPHCNTADVIIVTRMA